MKRGLFFLLLWLSVVATSHAQLSPVCADAAAAAGERTEADVWREMGLRYSLLRNFVTNRLTAESPRFVMAAAILNSLLERQNRVLLPAGFDLAKLPPGKIVFNQNYSFIYEFEQAPDLRKLWLEARPIWKELASSPERVDFDKLFEWVIPRCDRVEESLQTIEALNAGLNDNDPHSRLEPNETRKLIENSAGGQLKGLGLQIGTDRGRVWVAGIPRESKAAEEGFRVKDEIIAIDGAPTRGLDTHQVSKLLQGEVGSRKKIRVTRNGQTIEIEAAIKVVPSPIAWGRTTRVDGGKIGVLKVKHFSSSKLIEQVTEEIRAFDKAKAAGIVLDLRDNPGGDVTVTMAFLGLFLGPNRHIMTTAEIDGSSAQPVFSTQNKITDLPLLVLVNQNSASGAEVAAASLQQTGRAFVIGERTFGKGTVQRYGAPDPEGPFGGLPIHLYQTRAMYYVPPGKSPQIYGVPPDFIAYHKPGLTEADLPSLREGDLYNAYPNKQGPLETSKRKDREEVRKCLQTTATADQHFYSTRLNDIGHDYQMLVAADVMRCLWRL